MSENNDPNPIGCLLIIIVGFFSSLPWIAFYGLLWHDIKTPWGTFNLDVWPPHKVELRMVLTHDNLRPDS